MNWNDLQTLTAPTWINLQEFYQLLLSSETMHLSGWASEGDPAFKSVAAVVTRHVGKAYCEDAPSLIGGVCLNGVVCVFLHDPSDGYRSYLSSALVLPKHSLTTTFSPVPIEALMASHTDHWDDPQTHEHPSLLELVAVDTNQIVVRVGTDCHDSYYPSSVFYLDALRLDEAMPLATHRTLSNVVGNSGAKSVRKI